MAKILATLSKSVIEDLYESNCIMISNFAGLHQTCTAFQKIIRKKKRTVRMGSFNAGNDILCFVENVAEGIQEILKRIDRSKKAIIESKKM
jgi:hypothetical protein